MHGLLHRVLVAKRFSAGKFKTAWIQALVTSWVVNKVYWPFMASLLLYHCISLYVKLRRSLQCLVCANIYYRGDSTHARSCWQPVSCYSEFLWLQSSTVVAQRLFTININIKTLPHARAQKQKVRVWWPWCAWKPISRKPGGRGCTELFYHGLLWHTTMPRVDRTVK